MHSHRPIVLFLAILIPCLGAMAEDQARQEKALRARVARSAADMAAKAGWPQEWYNLDATRKLIELQGNQGIGIEARIRTEERLSALRLGAITANPLQCMTPGLAAAEADAEVALFKQIEAQGRADEYLRTKARQRVIELASVTEDLQRQLDDAEILGNDLLDADAARASLERERLVAQAETPELRAIHERLAQAIEASPGYAEARSHAENVASRVATDELRASRARIAALIAQTGTVPAEDAAVQGVPAGPTPAGDAATPDVQADPTPTSGAATPNVQADPAPAGDAAGPYGEAGPFQFRVTSFDIVKASEVGPNVLQGKPWLQAQGESLIACVGVHLRVTRKLSESELASLRHDLGDMYFGVVELGGSGYGQKPGDPLLFSSRVLLLSPTGRTGVPCWAALGDGSVPTIRFTVANEGDYWIAYPLTEEFDLTLAFAYDPSNVNPLVAVMPFPGEGAVAQITMQGEGDYAVGYRQLEATGEGAYETAPARNTTTADAAAGVPPASDAAAPTPQSPAPIQVGHSGPVHSIAFSPDGLTLASASSDRTVILWDMATGAPRQTLAGHTDKVLSVAFSPDGKTVASGGLNGAVILWDAATGARKQTLNGHTRAVESLAFSPDGKALASGSADSTVILWDVATGTPRQTLKGFTGAIGCVAFSPDGCTLAYGSVVDGAALWDVAKRRNRGALKGHGVASNLKALVSQMARSGHTVRAKIAKDPVTALAFGPDGRSILAGYADGAVILWNAASARKLAALPGHDPGPAPNTLTVIGVITDPTDEGVEQTGVVFAGKPDYVRGVAFSPDGRVLATGADDKLVILWDPATGRQRARLAGHTDAVYGVAFSPDGTTLASASGDKTVILWDVATGKRTRTLGGQAAAEEPVASAETRYRATPTWPELSGEISALVAVRNITVTGAPGGVNVRTNQDGAIAMISGQMYVEIPGAANVSIAIDPGFGSTTYAGLRFTTPCTVAILRDCTVVSRETGVAATDAPGRVWRSAPVTLNGKRCNVFLPVAR